MTYYLSSSHSTLEEAQAVLAAEGGWRCKQGRNSAKGSKKYEPTVPKASTTKKVAVPKTSKKRGPRGPYKKNIQQ